MEIRRTSDKQIVNYHTRQQQKKTLKKRPALKLGCWNVQTMIPSLSQDLQDISDARKTTVINDKLKRLNVNIATLQETWLANAGTLKERDYTFFWQGKSSDEPRAQSRLCSTEGPLKAQSPSSVCMPQHCLPLQMPRMNSTRTLHPPSGTSPVPSNLFSWVTSMPEWVQMTHGPLALVLLEWGKWMRMGSNCLNSVSFTTCALLTPFSRPSLNTRSPQVSPLAPTGSDPGQACCHQEHSSHMLLPQCGLWHGPLPGML